MSDGVATADTPEQQLAELFQKGGTGDREALAGLVAYCMVDSTPTQLEALAAAQAFARLAAYGHNRVGDWLMLAQILFLCAIELQRVGAAERSAAMLDQTSAIIDWVEQNASGDDLCRLVMTLSDFSDRGDERAALRLNRIMGKLSPREAKKVNASVKRAREELAALVTATLDRE